VESVLSYTQETPASEVTNMIGALSETSRSRCSFGRLHHDSILGEGFRCFLGERSGPVSGSAGCNTSNVDSLPAICLSSTGVWKFVTTSILPHVRECRELAIELRLVVTQIKNCEPALFGSRKIVATMFLFEGTLLISGLRRD